MKVTALHTVVPDLALSRPFFFVVLETDEGIVGLGQTADVRTVEIVHELGRMFVLGADPMRVSAIWERAYEWVAYHGYAGAEARALSAIDIALWDIRGKALGRPVVELLGGPIRTSIPAYNTCGSYRDVSDGRRVREDPVGLAQELLESGISGMKWAPFEPSALESNGQSITPAQLAAGVAGIEKVATALGDRMEIMVELHSLWSAGCAGQIARALDGLPVRWIEDPIAQDNAAEWARLREKSPVPIAGGERLQTRFQIHPLLAAGGVDVLISDVTWAGGITEGRRIAELADLYGVGFATHDNSGPVNLWASAHVLAAERNAVAAESVRAYVEPPNGYYRDVVDGPGILAGGQLAAPTGPGLGIELRADLPALDRRTSTVD